MHRTTFRTSILMMGLLALPQPSILSAPPGDFGVDNGEPRREEIQETIEIYMIAKMKRALDLSDEQERRVIPLVEELNASRREVNRKRRLTLMKLRPLVEEQDGSASSKGEPSIAALLDEMDAMDRQFRQHEDKMRAELRAALSPLQQARFLFFQERFRQEMQDRLRRLDQEGRPHGMEMRPRGGGPGNPSGPGEGLRPRPRP